MIRYSPLATGDGMPKRISSGTKEFNQYYHDTPILREENQELLKYRLVLVETIAKVLSKAMSILGITLPERM